MLERIATVISSHGYGHATRAAAVMAAVQSRQPACHFDIFTTVPAALFAESLVGPHRHHPVATDVGVVQKSALEEDLPATVAALAAFYPPREDHVAALAAAITAQRCRLVLCDIAPIGILAASRAGVPSVLIENFLWDQIYGGYVASEPRLQPFIAMMTGLFRQATVHIQTEPVCAPLPGADLTVPPVARKPHTTRADLRRRLGIPADQPTVLITMGGLAEATPFLNRLGDHPHTLFLLPGGAYEGTPGANVRMLPRHAGIYHPDLVQAADAVVGKLGYSTLAEVYHAGVPFGYITREGFSESEALARFASRHQMGVAIRAEAFRDGSWLEALEALMRTPRTSGPRPNGADTIAEFLLAGRAAE